MLPTTQKLQASTEGVSLKNALQNVVLQQWTPHASVRLHPKADVLPMKAAMPISSLQKKPELQARKAIVVIAVVQSQLTKFEVLRTRDS